MRLIKKGEEPEFLIKAKKMSIEEGGTYEKLDKTHLIDALMKDQGYICAFCMVRINVKDSKRERVTIIHDPSWCWPWKIAHLIPQNPPANNSPEELEALRLRTLDWKNLFGACRGNDLDKRAEKTCDTRQKNRVPTINPLNQVHIESLKCKTDKIDGTEQMGCILFSSDNDMNNDIEEIFGLNKGYLPDNRRETLRAFGDFIRKKMGDKYADKAKLQELYDEWKWENTSQSKLRSFCGIVAIRYKLNGLNLGLSQHRVK